MSNLRGCGNWSKGVIAEIGETRGRWGSVGNYESKKVRVHGTETYKRDGPDRKEGKVGRVYRSEDTREGHTSIV